MSALLIQEVLYGSLVREWKFYLYDWLRDIKDNQGQNQEENGMKCVCIIPEETLKIVSVRSWAKQGQI